MIDISIGIRKTERMSIEIAVLIDRLVPQSQTPKDPPWLCGLTRLSGAMTQEPLTNMVAASSGPTREGRRKRANDPSNIFVSGACIPPPAVRFDLAGVIRFPFRIVYNNGLDGRCLVPVLY